MRLPAAVGNLRLYSPGPTPQKITGTGKSHTWNNKIHELQVCKIKGNYCLADNRIKIPS